MSEAVEKAECCFFFAETVKEVVHVIVVEAPEIESVADRTIESMSPREGVIKAEARVEDVTEVEVPAENVKEAEATVGNGNDPMNVIVIDQEKTEVKKEDDQEVREKARA